MNRRRHRPLVVFFSGEQLSITAVGRGLDREAPVAGSFYDRYLDPYLPLICILLGSLEYLAMSVKLMIKVQVDYFSRTPPAMKGGLICHRRYLSQSSVAALAPANNSLASASHNNDSNRKHVAGPVRRFMSALTCT